MAEHSRWRVEKDRLANGLHGSFVLDGVDFLRSAAKCSPYVYAVRVHQSTPYTTKY